MTLSLTLSLTQLSHTARCCTLLARCCTAGDTDGLLLFQYVMLLLMSQASGGQRQRRRLDQEWKSRESGFSFLYDRILHKTASASTPAPRIASVRPTPLARARIRYTVTAHRCSCTAPSLLSPGAGRAPPTPARPTTQQSSRPHGTHTHTITTVARPTPSPSVGTTSQLHPCPTIFTASPT